MSPQTMEAIALEITKQRIKIRSVNDIMHDEDDAYNWVITFSLALEQVKKEASQLNLE